jgi:hypothetical protein
MGELIIILGIILILGSRILYLEDQIEQERGYSGRLERQSVTHSHDE